MVRETRHLWVGNLPENIREDRIREHFKRYGRVQSVKLLPRGEECPVDGGSGGGALGEQNEVGSIGGSGNIGSGTTSTGGASAAVAFMDIKSAAKAHATEHILDERVLTTQYYEPQHLQHRFPTHGSSEDHVSSGGGSVGSVGASGIGVGSGAVSERGVDRGSETFESRVSHGSFYPGDRNNRVEHSVDSSTIEPVVYIPRTRPTPGSGYHVTSTRARDRLYPRPNSYAAGPPPPSHLDRHRGSIPMSSWLSYESGSSRYGTGPPPPSPVATDSYQEESGGGNSGGNTTSGGNSGTLRQHKKQRRKSRSGSSSPSGSSRSGSSTSSRSNSSGGSTSGGSSSPGSSPHRASNAAVSEDRRPLAICVRNLPARSSDTSLKDGLFHEYKKHGKVTWVKVVGAAGDRYALVCFKKPEDVEKALEVSHDKLFFGCKIEVAPYQGYDVEDNEFRPYEAELDEYHPKATRTLFIGNLEKDVTASELRKHFEPFGEIIEIDIKKQGAVSSYAFCQYSDISSVVKAMRSMDGEHLGSNRIKLGFGKSMPTTCVWVDGIGECVSEKYLNMQFHQFGPITQVVVDRERGHALVFFEQISCAQAAVKEMRGASLRGRRLQVDFASRECQETFYEHLERQGVTNEKPWDSRPSPAATFDVARDRTFESAVTVPNAGSRFTRYETPPRARTASYSRTPGGGSTPGASPAHPTAMSRSSRRSYQTDPYYEGDYTEPTPRRFRSYDEYSQGSGASHDDYETSVIGDGKLNDDDLPPPTRRHIVQSLVASIDPPAPPPILLPPPDIRHLQKERVHLLEQLEECHSSGDEGFAPKKRLKLDNASAILCDDDEPEIASLLVTSHSGRKGMDVRRVSDSKILVHHGNRRGSCEGRGPGPCKRRRDTSSRHHEHHDGSRPGTPLVDERPENLIPSEPRRFRERSQEGPLSLPLPRFAAQMMNNNNNTSNSNNNGNCPRTSTSTVPKVASPPCVVSLPSIPSPRAAPQPPASPPPRHPSPSPTSSDSETAPQSPSLEERIRSLDEKYEKWSGSRALSAAGGDALAKLDATASERFRFRHKLLDLDLNEVQPSDIVKSVLAKRSVFDEDSKRLENFSEKYEPREFTGVTGVGGVAGSKSSSSASTCGKVCLQYPFPSHPPVQSVGTTSSSLSISSSPGSLTTTPTTTTLVSPLSKTDPRTAVHNCVHPTPATPITPGTSIKTASPELPPVTLPIGLPSGTAAGNYGTGSSQSTNTNLNMGSASMSSMSTTSTTTSTSSAAVTTAIALVTTATTTITTSSSLISSSSHHQTTPSNQLVTNTSSSCSSASSTASSTTSDPSRIRSKKDTCNRESRDSRDSKHSRSKDSSRKRKEEVDSEKSNRKDRDEKEERPVSLTEPSIDAEIQNRETKESKDARHERKEKEERERREKEDRDRQERREKEDRDRQERKEREERERREKEELREKERVEKERQEKERKDREERERKEREELEAREKEKREKERIEKERKEREEKERQERREKEERERKEREIRFEKEKQEKERVRKEREEQEKREKDERERLEREKRREEKERIERERKREREERERLEREKRKEKEDRERIEKEKEREKEKEKEKEKREKEEKEKEKEKEKRDREEKEKIERDKHEKEKRKEREDHERKEKEKVEREKRRDRDDKDKEKRDREDPKKPPTENHLHNISNQTSGQASPAPIANKRRCSSQDAPPEEEAKRMKISEHRRDSKDRPRQNRKSEDRKHRNDPHRTSRENRESKDSSTSLQSQDSREGKETTQPHVELIKETVKDFKECRENRENRENRDSRENRENNRDICTSKDKQKKRSRLDRSEKERERSPRVSHELDKDFLARLDLAKRSDASPPNNQSVTSHQQRDSSREHHQHHSSSINLHSDNDDGHSSTHETQTRHPSHTTDTESDEPKKHSIFDIIDDGPAYISMYDKVKARSTKNMQKLEEEKRQVRLKDKFSQLKQSRARREEKKQSTSWDGDSVSSKALTEDEGTSESDSTRAKSLSRKGSRSRIHSDTSEEEESFNNKLHKIKTERFIESDVDLGFADTEEKHTPTDSSTINSVLAIKQEPRSSDEEERMQNVEFPVNHPSVINNHQRENRKKSHKKKQKKQKTSISSEEGITVKIEPPDNLEHKNKNILTAECRTNHLNDSSTTVTSVASTPAGEITEERMRADKKQRNKKEKRRERTSDDKVKARRKRLNRQEARDSQRMEDIFGPLSDDVDEAPPATFFNRLSDIPSENNAYASDSDGARSPTLDGDRVRRKTEKKRRQQAEDENSVDLAEAGREIEAKLLGLPSSPKSVAPSTEMNDHDVFRFTDDNDSIEPSTPTTAPEKVKEKKKKRKKSKEERSRKDYHHHHHHHHHNQHDKAGNLPYLGADPSPPRASSPLGRKVVSPTLISRETLISPIPKNPPVSTTAPLTPPAISPASAKTDKKKENKLIPGFGADIDETIHENAVKSISEPEERESGRQSSTETHELDVPVVVAPPPPQAEDKPRVIISQEETEDAVAALLEETFGGSTEDFSYEGDEEEPAGNSVSVPPSDAPQEDVEEMQQAVDSLNASTTETDADLKPDTPQSEHDLQIDTDTEEDPSYESFDLTQPPKTPDIPSFYKTPGIKPPIMLPEKTLNCTRPSTPPTVISHSWSGDHKPVMKSPQIEAAETEVNQEKTSTGPDVSPATETSQPQYKQPLPCGIPIISESPRISAASPRPPITTTAGQPLYQRLPFTPQTQMIPPLRQASPRLPAVTTTISSVSVAPVPPLVQSRMPNLASSQLSPRVTQPLSPNGQWSRNPALSPHLSHSGKPTTPPARIPVSVPLSAHRPEITSGHIYSTAASQQPVIQHAPGMRAVAPNYPRGGLPPLTLNIPPRPYMPVPPLTSGMQPKSRDSTTLDKSVIETLIPVNPNEPTQRLEESKLSPAVIPEPTNKASTSPKVPSPNQPPTFIPETAKIETNASTSTVLSKSMSVESVALSPKLQKHTGIVEDLLSPKQKPELAGNMHLLTTHAARASTPSPVIVAHGQPHLVHKSIALAPQNLPPSNQSLVKTVTQIHHETKGITSTPIVSQAHSQPSGKLTSPRQQAISQGILVVKPHVPIVSTTQSLISRVMTPAVTPSSTSISLVPPPITDHSGSEIRDKFTSSQKTNVETIVEKPVIPQPMQLTPPVRSTQAIEVKQEEEPHVPEVPKVQEHETKPIEKVVETSEIKPKVEKLENEKIEHSLPISKSIDISDSKQLKAEPKVKSEPFEEVNHDAEIKKTPEEDVGDIEESVKEPSTDPLALDIVKEDATDSKEDSDYWSAKEVNIESVIKSVDALCDGEGNDNETHDEDENHDQEANGESHDTSKSDDWLDNESIEGDSKKDFSNNEDQDEGVETCEIELTKSRRGRAKNRRGSGRGGVTTRRGVRTAVGNRRGGRPGRGGKQEKNKLPADVYEFHDDSEEDNAGRPRLILTIKSPGPNATGPNASPVQPVAAVKEIPAEEFLSPAANTRKSKRLAEKDGSRTTVDDTIEDVVRGTPPNKALLAAGGIHATRRSTRFNNKPRTPLPPPLVVFDEPKKSRVGRKAIRRTSENNEDSSEEKSKENAVGRELSHGEVEHGPNKEAIKVEENVKQVPPKTSLKSTPLEPMTLIDPVTGMLIPMRESEEGQYIPVSTASGQAGPRSLVDARPNTTLTMSSAEVRPRQHPEVVPHLPEVKKSEPGREPADLSQSLKSQAVTTSQPSVITKPPSIPVTTSPVIQSTITPTTTTLMTTATNRKVPQTTSTTTTQSKPTSLKAHVLNASKLASTPTPQPIVVSKPVVPTPLTVQNIIKQPSQAVQGLRLQVPPGRVVSPSLSPRAKHQIPVTTAPPNGKQGQPMSPVLNCSNIPPNPKQHLLQAAKQQQQQQQQQQPPTLVNLPQKHPLNIHPSNVGTAPVQRIHNSVSQPPAPKGINGQPHLSSPKAHLLQAVVPTIIPGGIASPPAQPHIIAGQAVVSAVNCSRSGVPKSQIPGSMEPPKVEMSMSGCSIMVPTISPQTHGVPVPPYETSLHGTAGAAPSPGGQYGLVPPHRTQSPPLPPPAHHHANASQGDVVNHYGNLTRAGELPAHYMHPLQYQYLRAQQEALTAPRIAYHVPGARSPHLPLDPKMEASGEESHSPPLELRRGTRTPQDRTTDSPQVAQVYMLHGGQRLPPPPPQYNTGGNPSLTGAPTVPRGGYYEPPPAHIRSQFPMAASEAPERALTPDRHRKLQVATPPHASQVPPQADSLLMLLQRYPVMWQGLLALKNDQAAVQMHFVFGNPNVARDSLPCNGDGTTPPLRIAQRMRLEQTQVEGVARKMQTDNEHCMLLALPCGRDHMDVLQQSKNLQTGFITYLQQKQAAGIVNIAAPGSQQPAYVVHIFPSCDFANESLARIAPDLLHRVAEIAHLVIVIATV